MKKIITLIIITTLFLAGCVTTPEQSSSENMVGETREDEPVQEQPVNTLPIIENGGSGIIAFADGETRERLGPEKLSIIAETWSGDPGFRSLIIRPYSGPPWCLQFVYAPANGKSIDDLISGAEEANDIYTVRGDWASDFIINRSIDVTDPMDMSQSFSAGTIVLDNGDPRISKAVAAKMAEDPAFLSVIDRLGSIQFIFRGSEEEENRIIDELDAEFEMNYTWEIFSFEEAEYIVLP